MKSKENLVFIGMMGSGKSSIGSMVSKKLNLNFFDIDQLIENDQKMKISKIFETKGENFFRDIEKKIALNILKNKKGVIALGGGAFINRAIKNEVLENHLSFWLSWNIDTLINRIKNSKKRPKVAELTLQEIRKLLVSRSKIYIKADFKINCDKLDKFQITKNILEFYEK